MPVLSFSALIRFRISACTVTSSAVVGSSAISTSGWLASAIAIITRWRCPPDSWCGYWFSRASGSGICTSSSSSSALAIASALRDLVVDAQDFGDLRCRWCRPGSASSSVPERSSTAGCRAGCAFRASDSCAMSCAVHRVMSVCGLTVARLDNSRMMARAVTDLPEPDFAHQGDGLALVQGEGDVLHGLDHCRRRP